MDSLVERLFESGKYCVSDTNTKVQVVQHGPEYQCSAH